MIRACRAGPRPRSFRPAACGRRTPRVASIVVVGGGLAGLVCAWRLARAGHDVEVLEREAEAGGSARGESSLGFRLERGPGLALRGDANLRVVLAALRLEWALLPAQEPTPRLLLDGRGP